VADFKSNAGIWDLPGWLAATFRAPVQLVGIYGEKKGAQPLGWAHQLLETVEQGKNPNNSNAQEEEEGQAYKIDSNDGCHLIEGGTVSPLSLLRPVS